LKSLWNLTSFTLHSFNHRVTVRNGRGND